MSSANSPCAEAVTNVPVDWTDAHHLTPWYHGGTTSVDGLILLCRYHHHLTHEAGWRILFDPATGEVNAVRPDGTPYKIGPSQPWTTPTTRRDDLPDAA